MINCCKDLEEKIKKNFVLKNIKYREYSFGKFYKPFLSHVIQNCPWCGVKFKKDLRDEWFETISKEYNLVKDSSEFDYFIENKMYASEFNNDEWWIKRGL